VAICALQGVEEDDKRQQASRAKEADRGIKALFCSKKFHHLLVTSISIN
jgi:hypothetical protein